MYDACCASCGADIGSSAKFCSECGTPLTRAAQTAEYKQVTVLFADVVHSMDIARSVGPERLREIMAQLVDCASAAVQRYGGSVDTFTGDGLMAVFGAPVALEDHALRACLAALAIQDDTRAVADGVKRRDGVDLELRIGLNSGQVIAGEVGSGAVRYTAIGEHVGTAQRMESAAPRGGVMLSASTAQLVDGVAKLSEPELVHIKGADESVPARRLLGVGQHNRPKRVESNLVGRRWEMSALEGLLDRAVDGRGAVVAVVGPAGIGKSRLTRELAAMARERDVNVFTTFCESHTSQVPFHVIAQLLRAATGVEGLDGPAARALLNSQGFGAADPEDVALLEDLLGIRDPDAVPPRIDPDARRRRLTALVNGASLASQTPAVYVTEDAQWIDESSESMLADFLTVIPRTRLLALITYRPEYRGALAQVPGAQTIVVEPLSEPETAALVSELLGPDPSVRDVGTAIVERASGTPFFAEEIVRELAERGVLQGVRGEYASRMTAAEVSVPATLQATIASRIDRLEPNAKRTLSAAAVVGSRFGVDLLTALGVEPAVNDLLAAQLIDQVTFTQHAEYVFHHPLIRAVAYETQLKSDRADLHRRVATALEDQSPGSLDENAALVAEHREAAGDLHAAFEWHMRAGVWSNNRDVAAARVSWERARRVADMLPDDDPDRTAKRIAPRTVLCATGWRVHAHDSDVRFEELRQLCALADDKTSLAIGMIGPMASHNWRGEMRDASRLASEQMALLESLDDPSLSVQAGFVANGVKAQTGHMADVLRWAETAIEWADGDPAKGGLMIGSPLAVALALRGLTRSWFGRPGWREDFDHALDLAETADPMTLAQVIAWRNGLGTLFGVLRADDAAVDSSDRALQALEASGDDYAVDQVKFTLGCVLQRRDATGDHRRSRELLAHVREMCAQQRFALAVLPAINVFSGRGLARDGDRPGGVRLIRTAVDDMFTSSMVGYCVGATGMLVETLLTSGGDADAAEAAVARLEAAPAEGSVVRDVWQLRSRALVARARGDDAGYRDLRDRYRTMATALGFEGHMDWAEAMP
jgi:class 3 adenylate cyclase